MANAPFTWTPTNVTPGNAAGGVLGTPLPGGNVKCGDWAQVFVNYRSTNSTPVVYAPGHFLIHAIYTPNSDDAQPHADQPTTYGGPPSGTNGLGANRRRNFHIDPGVAFQCPWDGQLSIIAGGVSAADTCVCDIVWVRGHAPQDVLAQARMLLESREMRDNAVSPEDVHISNIIAQTSTVPRHMWAPPVIGVPQLVPATYVDIRSGTAINFPDGAAKMSTVINNAGALAPATVTATVMGNAIQFFLGSGVPSDIGSLAQGFACTSGTPATWTPNVDLSLVTILSSLGG